MSKYCGIDLHARSVQMCIIDEFGDKVKECRQEPDLKRILAVLAGHGPDVQVAVESTNNWYWLVDGLAAAGYEVHLAHAYGLRVISQAKVKTDKRDARSLARLLRLGELPEGYIYPREQRGVRDLCRRRQKLVKLRTQCYNEIRGLLLMHNCNTFTRAEIRAMSRREVARLPLPEESRWYWGVVRERLALLIRQIEALEAYLHERAGEEPAIRFLQELPGVGPVLALSIFCETGDVSRFPSRRHYSSYCRVVPPVSQTGTTVRRGRGGKAGNKYIKCAFSQAAASAVANYEEIRRFRDRKIGPRPSKVRRLVANSIVSHRLALAAYVTLKEQCPVEWRDFIR